MRELVVLAVLIASHNRKCQTLRCLSSLYVQSVSGVRLRVYLVDDGSTDGTSQAVRENYPEVTVIPGTGNLYWARSMALAWRCAQSSYYDAVLWLNDDVEMYEDALLRMWEQAECYDRERAQHAIVVGSLLDPVDGQWSYGLGNQTSWWHPTRGHSVPPEPARLVAGNAFHGNLVWIPRQVEEQVGIIDARYSHGMGDMDYAQRARRIHVPIVTPPGYLGTCRRNPDNAYSIRARASRKFAPPGDWWYFVRRHSPMVAWPAAFISPYVGSLLLGLGLRRRQLRG